MKILFPTGSYYPDNSGGPSITLYWITKALAKKKVDCYVVTDSANLKNSAGIVFNKWSIVDDVNVNYTLNKFHQCPFFMLYHSLKMISKVDIIVLTSIFYFPSFLISIVSVIKKKPIIWSVRGELDPDAIKFNNKTKKLLLFFIDLFLKKRIIFHATCEAEMKYIKETFGLGIHVVEIPNYMFFQKKTKITSSQKQIKKYFLYIGRIHEKKAIDNLINALIKSKKFLESEMELKIAGDFNNDYGKLLKRIVKKNNIENKIYFLGHVSSMFKRELYHNAYFTIMPSHTENFGNVVVESLSHGTPVIASKGTPWEILEQHNAGFWVDNSPESLTKILEKVISMSKDEYQLYRNNALSLVKNEFDIEKKVNEWIDFFKILLYQ